jgi:hypothetical protein
MEQMALLFISSATSTPIITNVTGKKFNPSINKVVYHAPLSLAHTTGIAKTSCIFRKLKERR